MISIRDDHLNLVIFDQTILELVLIPATHKCKRNDKKGTPNSVPFLLWRRHPDLNWRSGCCRPMPYHLAIAPIGADYEARTRYLHLGKVALYQMS